MALIKIVLAFGAALLAGAVALTSGRLGFPLAPTLVAVAPLALAAGLLLRSALPKDPPAWFMPDR